MTETITNSNQDQEEHLESLQTLMFGSAEQIERLENGGQSAMFRGPMPPVSKKEFNAIKKSKNEDMIAHHRSNLDFEKQFED